MTDDAERTCAGMNLHGKDIKIFAGNSNKPLAAAMAECLGITLGRSEVGRFSDGEIQVSIQESVRGSDVYVVQSTSSPVNRNLMELLIMMDAFRRASAGRAQRHQKHHWEHRAGFPAGKDRRGGKAASGVRPGGLGAEPTDAG